MLPSDYQQFLSDLAAKLDRGAKEYGEVSFSRDPLELIEELKAECLDLAGWGYILWHRLEKMKETIMKLKIT